MDKSFLIASDEKLSDILFWWIWQCRKFHPSIPIQLVDFGLSKISLNKATLAGCSVITPNSLHSKYAWFNKPIAMSLSKSDVTLWMDIDTEFVKNVSDVFDMAQPNKLGLVRDQFYHSRGKPQHNSGVVLYKGKPDVLKAWEKAISISKQRGDQEVLLEMLEKEPKWREFVFDLPDKYNYVRLAYMVNASGADDLRVVHWTGPTGKGIIRGPKIMGLFRTEEKGSQYLTHDFKGDLNQYKPKEENADESKPVPKPIYNL